MRRLTGRVVGALAVALTLASLPACLTPPPAPATPPTELASGHITAAGRALGRAVVPLRVSGSATYVAAVVNDAQRAVLLVDTGATRTLLNPAVVKRLGMSIPPNAPRRVINVAGGRQYSVPFVRLRALQVGAIAVEDIDVGVYDVLPGRSEIGGILGFDFLKLFKFAIDHGGRTLTLEVPASTPSVDARALRDGALSAPMWTIGDTWTFRWASETESGTYVSTVSREAAVDGADCYVVTTGRRETFYRKGDLALVGESVDGATEYTMRPPMLHFLWPLAVGREWEEMPTVDRPREGASATAFTSRVEAEETVTVPAGTFHTLRIVRRLTATSAVAYEFWYAAAVKTWVRSRQGARTFELTAYTLR